MYITDLGSVQLMREVVRGQGYVDDGAQTIEILKKRGVTAVSIDTQKGIDVMPKPTTTPPRETAPLTLPKTVSFNAEMERAIAIHKEAVSLVRGVLSDVKMGRVIDATAVTQMADDIVGSVMRNQNALSCLGILRRKDNYLMEHSVNLAILMGVFGKFLGYDQAYIREMAAGAILHDIGKILVPDEILHKPSKLTDAEFAVMKAHPDHSRKILQTLPGISQIAVETAGQHHEKIDGTGYPDGLSKDQISIHGRMLAIIDVYDALTADRCYHDRITPQEALRRMLQWTQSHLDGELLQSFIKAIGVYPVGTLVCLESGKMGVVISMQANQPLKPVVRIFYSYKHRHYVSVRDLDLSKSQVADRIVRTEDPRKLNIDIQPFLPSA